MMFRETEILAALAEPRGKPIKARGLARRLGIDDADYPLFRESLKELVKAGRIELGRGQSLTLPSAKPAKETELIGVFKGRRLGGGSVRLRTKLGDRTARS